MTLNRNSDSATTSRSFLMEALLHIYYSAAKAQKKADEFFRHHGLTDVQFNVMMLLNPKAAKVGDLPRSNSAA